MKLSEIKRAVKHGVTVHYMTDNIVVHEKNGEFFTRNTRSGYVDELTFSDNITLKGHADWYYIKPEQL